MKRLFSSLMLIVSLFGHSQSSIITGTVHQAPMNDTLSSYGSYITAADEGGFFVSSHAYQSTYELFVNNFRASDDSIYFIFPIDSVNTASQKFKRSRIGIAPPQNTTLSMRFGACLLEMGDFLLIGDTSYVIDQTLRRSLAPRVFLYEEVITPSGTRWMYTGKSQEFYDNPSRVIQKIRDIEKISENEIALAIDDSLIILDFDPSATQFLSKKQVIPAQSFNYATYFACIESVGDLIITSVPMINNSIYFTQEGGLLVFRRDSINGNYIEISSVTRANGNSYDALGAKMEVEVINNKDTLVLASRNSNSGTNNHIILFRLINGNLFAQDSMAIGRFSALQYNGTHLPIIDIDANHGKFYFLNEGDSSYYNTNFSIGSVKVFSPIEVNGKYELNWTETILPPAGAVGDTNIISGSVAIGNKLETSQPSTTWTYAWAVGMDKLNSSNGSPRVGGWLTPWSNSSNNIAVNEFDTPSIEVYPNPAQDYFIISGEDLNEADAIFLSDLNGRILRNIPVTSIETVVKREDLDSGIYLVQIQFGQIVLNQKVIFE